MISLKEE